MELIKSMESTKLINEANKINKRVEPTKQFFRRNFCLFYHVTNISKKVW